MSLSTVGVLLASEGGEEVEGSAILIPALYDIFWSAVSFVIIFFLFWKWVLPQLKKALDARSAGIEEKLEQAERDRAEAQAMLEEYRSQLSEARSEAARLRTEGQADRAAIVAEARTEAEQAARLVTDQAQARIASDAATARAHLSRDVGILASDLAEKIVGESLDEDTKRRTIDRFVTDLEQVGASAAVTDAELEQ